MNDQRTGISDQRTAASDQKATVDNPQSTISNLQSTIRNPQSLVVFISGYGSNLQAILDACACGALPARVEAVISNKKDAYGLERARQAGIPAVYHPKPRELDRRLYDSGLAELAVSYRPDWIVLAGWMRVLSSTFLEHFPNQVVNLHPALPGTFPGTDAIQRAFEAYQRGEIAHTGVMVHLVPDEGVDAGPVLAQEVVPIEPQDTLQALEARMHAVEHRLLVATLKKLTTETVKIPKHKGHKGNEGKTRQNRLEIDIDEQQTGRGGSDG